MVEQLVVIEGASGLHARPAAAFVQAAKGFASTVRIVSGSKQADAKSILGVLSLGAGKGATVTLRAEGSDEAEALTHLVRFIQNGLGEG